MTYKFGSDFTAHYHYDDGHTDFAPSSDAPAIYLFANKPDWTIARAGTGALQTITSWTGGHSGSKDIEISAITDPDPTGGDVERRYWLAINYTNEVGGDVITDIQELTLTRPKGRIEKKEATISEIKKFFPEIVSYVTDDQLTDFVAIAKEQVKADFLKKGYELNRIVNNDAFYLAIAYKVISLSSHAEFREAGDRMYVRYEDYRDMYNEYIKDLKIEYDIDADGDVDVVAEAFMPLLLNAK